MQPQFQFWGRLNNSEIWVELDHKPIASLKKGISEANNKAFLGVFVVVVLVLFVCLFHFTSTLNCVIVYGSLPSTI